MALTFPAHPVQPLGSIEYLMPASSGYYGSSSSCNPVMKSRRACIQNFQTTAQSQDFNLVPRNEIRLVKQIIAALHTLDYCAHKQPSTWQSRELLVKAAKSLFSATLLNCPQNGRDDYISTNHSGSTQRITWFSRFPLEQVAEMSIILTLLMTSPALHGLPIRMLHGYLLRFRQSSSMS